MKPVTPDCWHWKINPEQIVNIKAGDRETVNRVYMDNLDKFKMIAWRYCDKARNLSVVQDCVQQIYIDLPMYDFTNTRTFYWSIRKSFRIASMFTRRSFISLETPLIADGNLTLGDTLECANAFSDLDERENACAVLEIIAEQTHLSDYQRDCLTAFAFGVSLYKGIFDYECKQAYSA